jgi:hypothetical protein
VVSAAAALAVVVVALAALAAMEATEAVAVAGLCTKALCTAPVAVVVAHLLRMAAVRRTMARKGRLGDMLQVQGLQTPVTVAVVDTNSVKVVAMVVRAL